MQKLLIFGAVTLLVTCNGYAGTPDLRNLNQTQVDAVFDTFGADLAFRPLEPASVYGKDWGFAFGAIGGVASASKIKESISGTGISYLPNADLFLGVQGPMGFALEFGFVPNIKAGTAKFKKFGGDLKWTANEMLSFLPLDLAARLMLGGAKLSYSQTISGIPDTVTYDASHWGLNVSASKAFSIIEPYLGLGLIHQSATLSNSATIPIFNSTLTASNSFEQGSTSPWFYAGFQLKLLVLNLTFEYDSLFGVNTYEAKLGFKF